MLGGRWCKAACGGVPLLLVACSVQPADGQSFATEGACEHDYIDLDPQDLTVFGFSAADFVAQANALPRPLFNYHPSFPWESSPLTITFSNPRNVQHAVCPPLSTSIEVDFHLATQDGALFHDGPVTISGGDGVLHITLGSEVVTLSSNDLGGIEPTLGFAGEWTYDESGVTGTRGEVWLVDCWGQSYPPYETECNPVDELGHWP